MQIRRMSILNEKVLNQKCRGCLKDIIIDAAEHLSDPVVRSLYNQCVRLNTLNHNELPEYLCSDCHKFCISWSNFKQKCSGSERLLKLWLRQQSTSKCGRKEQFISSNIHAEAWLIQEKLFKATDEAPQNNCDLDCRRCGDKLTANEFFQHNCPVQEPEEFEFKTEADVSDVEFNDSHLLDEVKSDDEDDDDDDDGGNSTDGGAPKAEKKTSTVTLNTKRYPCKQCGIRFRRPIILKRHELSHGIVKDPRCVNCDISFPSVVELDEHSNTMHNLVLVYNYNCMYCHEKFSKYPILLKHLYKHDEALKLLPNTRHQCPKCDDNKSSDKALKRHVKICVPFSNICKECGEVCKNASLYRTHMRTHQKKQNEEFLCTTCGKSYKSKKSLRDHSSTHAPHTEKCDICHRVFSGPVRLNVHMQRVHLNKKRVKCEMCELDFRDAYSMRAHMAQHEEKKYTCNMCTQGFKFKLSLERHQAKCYPGKKPKVVTPKKRAFDKARVFCPCCNEGFTTLKLFRQHLDEVHRAEGIDIEEAFNSIKNIDCPQCHKKFATQVNLKDHMLTHSTLKPFVCEVCNKAFRDSTLLNYHMLTHKK